MAYNEGLAVGLAIGLPCFFIALICLGFYLRRRRLQKEEDRAEDYDGDNNSFQEFGEALHEPYQKAQPPPEAETADNTQISMEKLSMSGDTNSHSKDSTSSPERSTKRPFALPHANSSQSMQHHSKKNSAYDFYDTFIPIMPSDGARDLDLAQPPSISTDKHSLHSNGTSNNASRKASMSHDNSSRSLDNLAKQLQNPQFFGMSPTRQASVAPKSPRAFNSVHTSTSDILSNTAFENGGINDNFVNERMSRHPYRERTGEEHTDHEETDQETGGKAPKPIMSLERNFDNDFDPEVISDDSPDVKFK